MMQIALRGFTGLRETAAAPQVVAPQRTAPIDQIESSDHSWSFAKIAGKFLGRAEQILSDRRIVKAAVGAVLAGMAFFVDPGSVHAQTTDVARPAYTVSVAPEVPASQLPSFVQTQRPELRFGARGDAVRTLQNALERHGYELGEIDGKFGPRTLRALETFQERNDLPVTGTSNAGTWQKLESQRVISQDAPGVTLRPVLSRGATGSEVVSLQGLLADLDYPVGSQDGSFGRRTERAVETFQRLNDLPRTGVVTAETWTVLDSGDAVRFPPIQRYAPFAQDTIRLFERAADAAGVPRAWASSRSLHNILARESNGEVGKPNYSYGQAIIDDHTRWGEVHEQLRAGRITARSSATGLGQLLLDNVEAYYPSGVAGIGNAHEEAVGMLRYIKARYGSPERAWQLYGRLHEGY